MLTSSLFHLTKTDEKKYRGKEPWQKPLQIFRATDGKLKAAFEKRVAGAAYVNPKYWVEQESSGQAAVKDVNERWLAAVKQALAEGKSLSADVAESIRYNFLEMKDELHQWVIITDKLQGINWRRGLDIKRIESMPVLLYQGYAKGIVVDGYIMILSTKAAEDLLGSVIRKKKLAPAELAEETAKGTFPDVGLFWPDSSRAKPLKLIAQAQVPDEYDGVIYAYLTNGETVTMVDSAELALVLHYFPDAVMMQDNPCDRIVLQAKGKRLGILMPSHWDLSRYPRLVTEYVRGLKKPG